MTAEEFEKEAFALRPELEALASRWLGTPDDAEDMVQDAMLKLWAMCADLRSPIAPLARVLVRNICVDHMRRHHYTLSIDTTDVPDLSHGAADAECIDRMMAVVDSLPTAQQIVLRLRHIDGMSMADIAKLTGGTEVSVRKVLSRARKAVREQYLHKM